MKASNKSSRKTASKSKLSSRGARSAEEEDAIARGGVATPFPWKLHEMLEDASKEGNEWIVCWQPHGSCFIVHKPKVFVEKIMPTYFNQSKFASFQRQLNLYGFNRITNGADKGAYYHGNFVRGQRALCRGMVRQKIKGTTVRRKVGAEDEPNFYEQTNIPSSSAFAFASSPPPLELEATRAPRRVSAPTSAGLSKKDRAFKERQERLNAVRDVLKQTENLCDNTREMDFHARTPSSASAIPSVSPMESEESDSDESSYPMSPQTSRRAISTTTRFVPSMLLEAPLEPLEPRYAALTPEQMKGGDILFFEGKPFHYLEHLDSLPPAPAKSKQVTTPPSCYQRDTLKSLMRVAPKSLLGAAF